MELGYSVANLVADTRRNTTASIDRETILDILKKPIMRRHLLWFLVDELGFPSEKALSPEEDKGLSDSEIMIGIFGKTPLHQNEHAVGESKQIVEKLLVYFARSSHAKRS